MGEEMNNQETSNVLNDPLLIGLMKEVTGDDITIKSDGIKTTIANILHDYNLSTDLSFIEKIATMKLPKEQNGNYDITEVPKELQDAAFLPVNTIADIALRQDLDLVISQIPEWFSALQITRDAICEADVVDGKLARSIVFNRSKTSELDDENLMATVESVEERLDLNSIVKNHLVFNTLEYGEGYVYAIPYAKVFEDLYKYRLRSDKHTEIDTINMFETSSVLNGFGYGESAVEVTLNDTIVADADAKKSKKGQKVFTEAEIMEINPQYRMKSFNEEGKEILIKEHAEYDDQYEKMINDIANNISYIGEDIALPVIEESAHDLRIVYETKYKNQHTYVQELKTFFEMVMEDGSMVSTQEENRNMSGEESISHQFRNIKGIYLRILPGTKLIPIRIDRNVIGYYYIADLTRPEESGERRNSGLTGYTLRSPSVGYDTFSPDKMFCERLATKIINNFNLKFMRDNISLHQQIVAILQAHKFNEAMMRFVFIPAENVIQCTINKDGIGKGHSMLEPGLVTARMYMFLKLYSILYQINNSQLRVYNLRMSGIDNNYAQLVKETMRKFAARRVTVNDIFNYRSSMTKVSGGSELIMPMGAGNEPPIEINTVDAAQSPINNELLEQLKNEAINSTPVPSLMVQTGGQSEIEFAKETELANTRFNTMISSFKIDFNWGITKLYRRILRWETDIDPNLIRDMKFMFKMPTAKHLNVTVEMVNNFKALVDDLIIPIFLSAEERKARKDSDDDSDVARELKKLLLAKYIPQIDIDEMEYMANQARKAGNVINMGKANDQANMLNDGEGEFESQ